MAASRRRQEVKEVYDAPLMELVYKAATVHRMFHDPRMARPATCDCSCSACLPAAERRSTLTTPVIFQVQQCTLMSIKTGGCPEDCSYCSQSSKHKESTGTKATKLADLDEVFEAWKPR